MSKVSDGVNRLAGASLLRWGMAGAYLALCFLPLLFLPNVIVIPLLIPWLWITIRSFLGAESYWGQVETIRPLTRWDVSDWERFQADLAEAAAQVGLRHPPVLAVLHQDEPNAMAITTPRGLVVLHRGLLQRFPQEEVTAIIGHELCHLASRDSWPAILGGSFLHLLAMISFQARVAANAAAQTIVALPLHLISIVIDLFLGTVGKLAEIMLAQRSRADEHQADLIGAKVTSARAMISALERLEQTASRWYEAPRWSVTWINQRLHASHPPLAARVRFLQERVERGELHG